MKSILLIDDDKALLAEYADGLRGRLADSAEIKTWVPSANENAYEVFHGLVDEETILVITDLDLTSQGQTGLFGTTIVAWCQGRAIPVGDFSRGNPGALPKAPDLFEIRVPTNAAEAVPFVASVFKGFSTIREALSTRTELLTRRSPSAVLAEILGPPAEENQFTLYDVRFGATIGVLMDRVTRTAPEDCEPEPSDKIALLSYITGHLLLNVVLRFPGPLLTLSALRGYLASDDAGEADIQALLTPAQYSGPFSDVGGACFWLMKVEEVIDSLLKDCAVSTPTETPGELYRLVVETKLGRTLDRHGCKRCGGRNGGFFCPFTGRTVCDRTDCSVGSSGWIPQGASLCRIERDFFDEWAPVLGL